MIYIIEGIRRLGGGYDTQIDVYQVIDHHSVITQEQLDKYYNGTNVVLVEDVNRIRYIECSTRKNTKYGEPINIITYNVCAQVSDYIRPSVEHKISVFDDMVSEYVSNLRTKKLSELGI